MTEPWWGNIGNDVKGPTAHARWTPILPVPVINRGERPRVMAYVKSRADFTVTLRSDIAADLDIQVLDIHQADFPTTTLVNIYSQPRDKKPNANQDEAQRDASMRLQDLHLPTNTPVVISGDWNQHHPRWSASNKTPSTKTQTLVDWLDEGGYSLINTKGEYTYHEHQARGAQSVIDLTWVNHAALNIDATKDWTVDPTLACGSDHFALRWSLDHGASEIEDVTGTRYNFKDAKADEWKREFSDNLLKNADRWEKLTDRTTHRTQQDLDEDVRLITEAMSQASSTTVPPRKPSDKAKPWWTAKLAEAGKRLEALREQKREYKARWGEQSQAIMSAIKKNTNHFRRLFKHERKTWLEKTVSEAGPNDIWKMRGWGKGTRNYPSPAITKPDGSKAVAHDDKCDALRSTLFKPPPPLPNNERPNLEQPQPDDIEHKPLSRSETREAIYRHSTAKAPGESQQTFTAVRWAWEAEEDLIFSLMHHCVETGHHPKQWRRAIAIALRKPNKPDYSQPKAYRLIQLLDCLGKVLEGIIATRISYMVGRDDLVPTNQFGGRPCSSTNDALVAHIEDIQAAKNHGKVTSVLTFDISGYFDNVNHARLLRELRRKGIPVQLVRWVESFLSDRQAAICLDGTRGEMKPVSNGIPQGSPISPILSIIYGSELLEIMEERRTYSLPANTRTLPLPDDPTDTVLDMYIDDGTLRVSSNSLETNAIILRHQFIFVNAWLERVGLSTAADKGEAMHHSWRRDGGLSPPIRLPMPDGTETTIVAGDTIRILGLHLDRKLTFDRHVQRITDKATKAVNCIRMLANTIKGLSQAHLRTLYRSCILPVLTYASPAWWTGKKGHINKLTKVQNVALRHMAGAFRTTPVKALEVHMSIFPIKHFFDLSVENYANRLHRLPRSHPVISRLPDAWRDGQPSTSPPPLPSHRPSTRRGRGDARRQTYPQSKPTKLEIIAASTYDPRRGEKITPMMRPPWDERRTTYGARLQIYGTKMGTSKETAAREHNERYDALKKNPANLVVYSDGSMLDDDRSHNTKNVGWGLAGYRAGREVFAKHGGLGHAAEVYDAELVGLARAASIATEYANDHPTVKNIYIYADNSAAIASIYGPKDAPGQSHILLFTHLTDTFLQADPNRSLTVAWCPGHSDVRGNERADEEAKKGAILWQPDYTTITHAKRKAKEGALARWTTEWKSTPPTGGFALANRIAPSSKPREYIVDTPREVFARLTQCRTRHAFIGEYYSTFVPNERTDCPCGHRFQTRGHILLDCPRYEAYRDILRDASEDLTIADLIGTLDGIKAVSDFLRKSGAFTKTGNQRDTINAPHPDDETSDEEEEAEWWERRALQAVEEGFGRVEEDRTDSDTDSSAEEVDEWEREWQEGEQRRRREMAGEE